MTKLVITTTSPEDASQLADVLNAYDVSVAENNTVEIGINKETDAALELLAQLVSAQPQYIALGIEAPWRTH